MPDEPTVVIIGGGVTGAGVLWDLTLRGIKCTLVEKGDLCNGASGRNHGLLHSGGRYAVKDPESARECASENLILKKIAPWAIEPCGGLFVLLQKDNPSYTDEWLKGCKAAGIEVESESVSVAYKCCPFLNPKIEAVFRVNDAAIDVFQLVRGLVLASRTLGAEIKTKTLVTEFVIKGDTICGVKTKNIVSGKEELIEALLVINATGSWADSIAKKANCKVEMLPDQGILLVLNSRLSSCVINRLREPGDGDILVPSYNVSIFGTTSAITDDPDEQIVKQADLEKLLSMGTELFPDLKSFRQLRAFAGVRPLLADTPNGEQSPTRSLSRTFRVINHENKDGVAGLISVVGGKFTTFRLMAEKTADIVTALLGINKPSTTSVTLIPQPNKTKRIWALNNPLGGEGNAPAVSDLLICECENVYASEILDATEELMDSWTLNDLRNRSRFGMGTCQGTLCAYRVLGLLKENELIPQSKTLELLKDFLEERWKGMLPIDSNDQLKEVEWAHALYNYTMGLDLPSWSEG